MANTGKYPSGYRKIWAKYDKIYTLNICFDHLTSDSLVLDVGGYKGQWASDIYSKYYSNIVIFEPVIVFSNSIERRFKFNSKIQVKNYGLSNKSEVKTIYFDWDGSSSFYLEEDKPKDKLEVKMVDILEFINNELTNFVDLMKLNVEGSEYDILDRLIQTNSLKYFNAFLIQFHNLEDVDCSKLRYKIRNTLIKNGFINNFCFPYIWESWIRKGIKKYILFNDDLTFMKEIEET